MLNGKMQMWPSSLVAVYSTSHDDDILNGSILQIPSRRAKLDNDSFPPKNLLLSHHRNLPLHEFIYS